MEINKERLDAFFQWLINDGLAPRKSKRLWRKTITAKLLNKDKMTLDNYQDFLEDYKQKLESSKCDSIPEIDPKVMIGIALKISDITKIVLNAIEADSYIHLFFDDGSDELVHKKMCIQIISPL